MQLFSSKDVGSISLRQEIIGGIANFMAMAYIIVVNPLVLHAKGAGFPIAPAITATVLTIVLLTILAGMVVKLPFIIAPGMGLNAVISYSLIIHDKLDVATALGVIILSGLLLLILSLTKIRGIIIAAIPECLQIAIGAGIGIFLFFIGAKNVGIIVATDGSLIGRGPLNLENGLALVGFILVAWLTLKKKQYAFLLPIILISIISFICYPHNFPKHLIEMPDFSLFFHANFWGALKLSLIPAILSIFIVNFFDATSTVMGLVTQIPFKHAENRAKCLKKSLIIDSLGTTIAGIFGTSPTVVMIESATAIHNGAKTGIAAIVTALCCIPFLFLSPLIAAIPAAATAPVLMIVGILMAFQGKKISVTYHEDLIAALVTMIMIPLCFSISMGAVSGILTYVSLKILLGKYKEVPKALIIVAILCAFWFIQAV